MPLHRPMELIEVETFLEPEIRIESVDHERVTMVFIGRAGAYVPLYHIIARLSRPRHAAVRPLDKRSISGMTRSFGNVLIGSRGTACNPVNPSESAHRGRVVVDEGPCQRNRVLGDALDRERERMDVVAVFPLGFIRELSESIGKVSTFQGDCDVHIASSFCVFPLFTVIFHKAPLGEWG